MISSSKKATDVEWWRPNEDESLGDGRRKEFKSVGDDERKDDDDDEEENDRGEKNEPKEESAWWLTRWSTAVDEESEEEDESAPTNLEDYTPGKYVLYKHTPRKVYVATIFEVAERVTLIKAARKYGERNGRVTFCWPQIDLFFYVDQLH